VVVVVVVLAVVAVIAKGVARPHPATTTTDSTAPASSPVRPSPVEVTGDQSTSQVTRIQR
jgi:hypothetical protein